MTSFNGYSADDITAIVLQRAGGLWSFDAPPDALAHVQKQAVEIITQAGLGQLVRKPEFPCHVMFTAGAQPVTVIEEDGHYVFRIAVDAPDVIQTLQEAYDAMHIKMERVKEENTTAKLGFFTGRIKPSDAIPHNRSFRFGRGRGATGTRYPWGQHFENIRHKRAYLAAPEEDTYGWGKKLQTLISEEGMAKYTPTEWLREIVRLNGLSSSALEALSGIYQSTWNAYINHEGKVPSFRATKFLLDTVLPRECSVASRGPRLTSGPLLGLPTVTIANKEYVRHDIALRIMRKFGHEEQYSKEAALKNPGWTATALEHVMDTIRAQELPRRVMVGVPETIAGYFKGAPHIPEKVLVEAWRKSSANTSLLATPFTEEEACEFAKRHARSAGEFLKFYRLSRKESLGDAAKKAHCSNIVLKFDEKNPSIPIARLNQIMATNAYGLPCDDNRQVRPDIEDYIHHLNQISRSWVRDDKASSYGLRNL